MLKSLKRVAAFLVLLLLVLSLASCSQPQEVPQPSNTFVPDPAIEQGEFTIAYLTSTDDTNKDITEVCLSHLQALLRQAGWGVYLKLESVEYSDTGLMISELIRKESALGKACDGYIVQPEIADQLLKDGLTQDLSAILPEAAPVFYSKYKDLFSGSVSGIPNRINTSATNRSIAFFLRSDIAGQPGVDIQNLSDVFELLESGDKTHRIFATLFSGGGYFPDIVDLFAKEHGYYPLSSYGMSGRFYARYDDDQYRPVPVEYIEGFKDFTDKCRGLVADGRIIEGFNIDEAISDADVGYIGTLAKSMVTNYFVNDQKRRLGSVAYPLTSFTSALPAWAQNGVYGEIAVTAGSKKAVNIVKLMQWCMSSQANYDLVNYGEEGREYRIVNGRLEPLRRGKALTREDWNYETTTVFYLINPRLFCDYSFERTTVFAAANYDDAMAVKFDSPPILAIKKLGGDFDTCRQIFNDISTSMESTLQKRGELIYGLIDSNYSNGRDSDQCMKELLDMKADTEKLATAYAERIKELRAQQGK